MTRVTFQEVKFSDKKTCKCETCHKRLSRSKTFSQTINPFNKNASGEVKSEAEIRGELIDEARAWRKAPEWCSEHTMEYWPAHRKNETEPVYYKGILYGVGEFREKVAKDEI